MVEIELSQLIYMKVMTMVIAMMMVVMMINIHLEAQDERTNYSSTSTAKVIVKYDEIHGDRSSAIGKSVKKSSKSCQKVEKVLKV